MAKPSVNKVQDCIDSAGRLAAFIDELYGECTLIDILTICADANVGLYRDVRISDEALTRFIDPPMVNPGEEGK